MSAYECPRKLGRKQEALVAALLTEPTHAAELPTGDKARLTASLVDALLRAIGVDVLDKRLEALQAVLGGRKDKAQ